MANTSKRNVTELLRAWGGGDQRALDELFSIIYKELRRSAGAYMRRERPNHTLQPTALVNEAYLRLAGESGMSWKDRSHFYGVAASAMRHVLVDYARAATADKRGGGRARAPLAQAMALAEEKKLDVIELHEALRKLEKADPEKARIIDLRYFLGLTVKEIAEVLDTSGSDVDRQLKMAKVWLFREMGESGDASKPKTD